MFETNKPHGIDFGRWTQWARPDNPPRPIDFVIAGVTSGNYTIQTYEANKIHLQAEKRLMTYHFYEPHYSAVVQADIYSRRIDELEPKAVWIDWEEYRGYVYGKGDVDKITEMVVRLEDKYPRVGIYANIDDLFIISKYNKELVQRVPLWIAYPPGPNSPYYEKTDWEDWPPTVLFGKDWEGMLGRSWDSVDFLQYDWTGDGPDYGTVNDKLEIDLDVYQGTMLELDNWLGINKGCLERLKGVFK